MRYQASTIDFEIQFTQILPLKTKLVGASWHLREIFFFFYLIQLSLTHVSTKFYPKIIERRQRLSNINSLERKHILASIPSPSPNYHARCEDIETKNSEYPCEPWISA